MTGYGMGAVDVFAGIKDATRCPDRHAVLGRCGFVAGHVGITHGCAVREQESLALHLWDGAETRRLEPGWWGMARRALPWASGYTFPASPTR